MPRETTPSFRKVSGLKASPSGSKSSVQCLSSINSCLTGNISESLSLAEWVESSLLLGVQGGSLASMGVRVVVMGVLAMDAGEELAVLLRVGAAVIVVHPTVDPVVAGADDGVLTGGVSILSLGLLGLVPQSVDVCVEVLWLLAPEVSRLADMFCKTFFCWVKKKDILIKSKMSINT